MAPPSTKAFWSYGTAHQGGVGLWAKESFLAKFPSCAWEELEEGRVAVLRLGGPSGKLDVFCVYLDTHSPSNRQNSLRAINNAVSPKEHLLSIVVGDFNYTYIYIYIYIF